MDINKLILNFIQKAKKLVNSIWGKKEHRLLILLYFKDYYKITVFKIVDIGKRMDI